MNKGLLRTCYTSLALVVGLALASCSGDSAAPMAPSSGAAAGATIQGLVNPSGATSGAASFGATAAGPGSLTVMVVGTDLVVDVGANGQFTITNVPPGRVQLHFTGTGTNATLDVGTITPNETLQIVVRVSGSSAALENEVSDDSPSESVDSVSSDDDSADDQSTDHESTDDDSTDDDSTDDESTDDESTDDDSSDDDSADDESLDDDSLDDDESLDDKSDDDASEDDDAEDDS